MMKMDTSAFQALIRTYYLQNRREFPWRYNSDPYEVLVSEIMLQQTQTERVLPKYMRFLDRFPRLADLAQARLDEVLRAWQGLGYNRRAIMLQKLAQEVVQIWGGRIPNRYEDLIALPGIGSYTANAVLAFAFNQPVVLIETNVRTVFIHCYFHNRTDIQDKEILPLIAETLDRECPRDWYYALMDYGVMLKKTYMNPNRKSAHYKKQSPFETSDRKIRGIIVRELLNSSAKDIPMLLKETSADYDRLRRILDKMLREGILVKQNDRYKIASE